MKRLYFQTLILIIVCLWQATASAQTIRIEDIKKNFSKKEWFKVSGGVSASGTYYTASEMHGHLPWTFMIQGNVNFKIFNLINLPFSFNFTNSGFTYAYPNMPNRFSLHPSYKWAAAHIGDISMTYSPYTLSGHQFTGIGADLTPGKWKASVMFGRLQRAVEYDPTNTSSTVQACYKRLGVGAKLRYDHSVFYVGGSIFLAKDYENSLRWKPDSLGITPQQNVAANIEVGFTLFKALRLYAEYAFSFLERDIRIENNASVKFYQAAKCGISYQINKTSFGFNYERIEPEYKTLGAYYFNSDLENYTLNVTSTFYKDKMSLAANAGVERDNIKNTKSSVSLRFVGSINWTFTPDEEWYIALDYSNFQTHKNVRSQFDYINQYDITENLDTLNFSQLNHNANMAVTWNVCKSDKRQHSLSLNSTFQMTQEEYADTTISVNPTLMLNSAIMHSAKISDKNVTVSTSANVTWSRTLGIESIYVGPTIAITALFVNRTLTWNNSLSANAGLMDGSYKRTVANVRTALTYTLKKHHLFTLNGIFQYQWVSGEDDIYRFNSTLAYAYNF